MAARNYNETKILVVDDEKLIRMTLSAVLRSTGYTPVAAASVTEALEKFQMDPRSFRAIITDIMMDGMDGFVFRDIVRGVDQAIPLFFMTALDPEEGGGFLARIMEDANSYYLSKSAKSGVILKRIKAVVASRRVEQFI